MKSNMYPLLFKEADVQQFVQAVGDQNPIYLSSERAQSHGYKTIPLPPTMPMIAYKLIETPWKLKSPIIHRKQQCEYHRVMYINQTYQGFIILKNQLRRHNLTFINQTLQIYDSSETLCFSGTTHLVAGDVIADD
jgi:acyl dehydratase